jgi:hypothetical protein
MRSILVAELNVTADVRYCVPQKVEVAMGFGKGALLWLLGIPIPIIILLALFWH